MLTRKRCTVLGVAIVLTVLLVTVAGPGGGRGTPGSAYAANGDLDATFGTGGKVTTDFITPGSLNEGRAIALQPDGKILVAGNVHIDGNDYDFGLVRYNANGTLDTNFGNHGWSTADFGLHRDDGAYALAIQPSDGKIVLVGSASRVVNNHNSYYFALARFNTNGFLDTSFDADGRALLCFQCVPGGETSVAYSVAIEPFSGKIVVGGFATYVGAPTVTFLVMARYNTNGTLDTKLGPFLPDAEARAVAIQQDGKIVAAGDVHVRSTNRDFALTRLQPNGNMDSSFGQGGYVTTDFLGGGDDVAYGMAIQPDVKIVAVGGFHTISTGYDFGVIRYLSNGAPDTTFADGGFQAITFGAGTSEEIAHAVALQLDGKIVVVGYAQGAGNDFAIARLNPDGSLDSTFGNGGKILTDFAGGNDVAQGVAVQAGKIVVAGDTSSGLGDFGVARYLLSSAAPPPAATPTATSVAPPNATPKPTLPPTDSRYFAQTGHTVKGLFLDYWETHGGLAQQGYPITEELQEKSDTDGQMYTMQYFQRAVFEYHPEKQPPYNVLLSLLGVFYYNDKYGGNASNQHASTINPRYFSQTGKTIGGAFRRYWEAHGGLAQQGYPISNEFQEVSQTDGKTYTVQYFQRAVFEYHPEFAGTQNEVLLSLLGVFYDKKKHP